MSKFTDALNSPLPSKLHMETTAEEYLEAMESELFENISEEETVDGLDNNTPVAEENGCANGKACEDADDDDDMDLDDDDFDPDDMSDEELAALDKELSNGALDSVIDDENEVDLSPEEEIQADDMMSIAATTMLVNDELNAEERAEFVQTHGETAVNEGFMSAVDVNELAMEAGLVQEGKYTNKMIIRLDAESKKKQLYALAVNVSAAAHGDPDYVKLKKVMKMRKILRAKLDRKYHAEATKRMKIYFARLRKSKAPALAKIGEKFSK